MSIKFFEIGTLILKAFIFTEFTDVGIVDCSALYISYDGWSETSYKLAENYQADFIGGELNHLFNVQLKSYVNCMQAQMAKMTAQNAKMTAQMVRMQMYIDSIGKYIQEMFSTFLV